MSKTWDHYGTHDPYYGVLSADAFRGTTLSDEALAKFFASGVDKVDEAIALAEQAFGPLSYTAALDYGCGAGRLSRRLIERFDQVIGVDVSEGMLKLARANLHDKNIAFEHAACMSDEPVSFIISLLVFQHIPVREGMTILPMLARRLRGTGIIDVPVRYTGGRLRGMLRKGNSILQHALPGREPLIPMYVYDPAAVREVLERGGCRVTMNPVEVPMFQKQRVIFQRHG
jgi:trans-aconitate methyltransferase